jgi:hypothetical protein
MEIKLAYCELPSASLHGIDLPSEFRLPGSKPSYKTRDSYDEIIQLPSLKLSNFLIPMKYYILPAPD